MAICLFSLILEAVFCIVNNEAAQPVPLLLTQQISDGGVSCPASDFGFFRGDCDAPDQVLGAGAGAEVWDALEKWEWARLYLHFTHITKQTRGPRTELGEGEALSPAIPGDTEQSLGPAMSPLPQGQLSQLGGAQV